MMNTDRNGQSRDAHRLPARLFGHYQPSRLRGIFRSLGKPANLAGGIFRPHRKSVTHGKPPQFAILNLAAVDRESSRESATQRLIIIPLQTDSSINAHVLP
jgi:hypothetical protein